ncbi:MAG: TIGR03936 family radical SAM-associated protein [Bacillota bacterium]|nr:TIGR03936 family radical SAM-associated protein [Bacillota bacterium]
MKVIVKYKKVGRLKFISHLDTIRLLQRAIRRAEIKILYSQGYNPHPKFSFAMPLSLGLETYGDYIEIELEDSENPNTIKERLNKVLPEYFQVVDAKESENSKTLAARLKYVLYKIELELENTNLDELNNINDEFFKEEQIVERIKIKKRRKKVKRFDGRRFIEKIEVVDFKNNNATLKVHGIFSNEGAIKMEELVELLKRLTLNIKDYKIVREDMIFE